VHCAKWLTSQAAAFPAPLVTTLARVEHQLGLLTQPRHLDTVARRVKVLVSDLERIHDARRKLGDTRPLNVALSSGMTVVAGGTGATVTTALPPPAMLSSAPPPAALPADALQRIDALFAILPRIEPLLPVLVERSDDWRTLGEALGVDMEATRHGYCSLDCPLTAPAKLPLCGG